MFTDFIPNQTYVAYKNDPDGLQGLVVEINDGEVMTIDWSGYGDLEFGVSLSDVIAV